jgi:glycerol kinase
MTDCVIAIDQGTTGTTALLLDKNVAVVASANVEFPNHYPQPGHVEHDVGEIWTSIESAVTLALAKAGDVNIVAIGITNQRETSLFWDAQSGDPIHRALVWQDRRTAEYCAELKAAGHEEEVRARTGLVLDPYFSGTKARWLLDHVDGARERAARGEILFGTIDAWLAWKLCGTHATDPSNASRTLLFNIHEMDWDPVLLELLNVPAACLPRICDNAEVLGTTSGLGFLPDGIPVSGMAGEAKCTYGTGAFILMNTGNRAVTSHSGLLTTVGWRLGGKTVYALEGSAFIAGAAVQWLRDGLGLIDSAEEIEALAGSVPDAGGVVFVPALAGLGAPHWRPDARGLFTGITGGTTKAHIARAVLEGMALQIADILGAMESDSGIVLSELKVDGGAAKNGLLMQYQADILRTRCVRPTVLETTALGAAFLAGLGIGFWDSPAKVRETWAVDSTFDPQMSDDDVEGHLAAWAAAITKA